MVSLYRDPHGMKIFTDQRDATVMMDVRAPHGRTDGAIVKTKLSKFNELSNLQPTGSISKTTGPLVLDESSTISQMTTNLKIWKRNMKFNTNKQKNLKVHHSLHDIDCMVP